MLRGIADPRYKKSYDVSPEVFIVATLLILLQRSLESAFAVISILAENLPLPPSSKLSYFMGNILSAAVRFFSLFEIYVC